MNCPRFLFMHGLLGKQLEKFRLVNRFFCINWDLLNKQVSCFPRQIIKSNIIRTENTTGT